MAIEFFEGFEGGTTVIKPEWQPGGGLSISSTTPRTGTYCGTFVTNPGVIALPATAKKTIGFNINFTTGYPSTTAPVVSVVSDAQATTHLSVTIDATGHPVLRRGSGSGTILATSATAIAIGVYRTLELQATIDDTTGTAIVKIDGTTVINYAGDTKNAGTSTNIDGFSFATNSNSIRYDDMWVTNGTDDTANTGRPDNDFLGDLKVERCLPNGNGASSQFVGSDGNSTDNYLLVDEEPTNTSDYVGSNTAGNRDLYTAADLGATTVSVYATRIGAFAAKSDAGPAGFKTVYRESGGTITAESNNSLSTTYTGYYGTTRPAKPSGGAWSVADVNGLQIGVEATAS